jgi:hypothetical protein
MTRPLLIVESGCPGPVGLIGQLILVLRNVFRREVRIMRVRGLLVAGIAVWLAIAGVACTTSDGLPSMDRDSFIPDWSVFQDVPKQTEPPLE